MASRCYAGQQVYKTTRQLVGAAAVGLCRNYGFMESRNYGLAELWNYGTTDRASRLTAHSSLLIAHSLITLYTLSAFYTL